MDFERQFPQDIPLPEFEDLIGEYGRPLILYSSGPRDFDRDADRLEQMYGYKEVRNVGCSLRAFLADKNNQNYKKHKNIMREFIVTFMFVRQA